jgi:CRP-like cAMP-binding protein
MTVKPFRNFILQRLSPESLERLQLQPLDLPVTTEIEFPGNRIAHVFFLEEGIVSMTATFEDGFEVEIALAGTEAILGASSMMGTRRSLNRVYMQVSGHGYSAKMDLATAEFRRGGRFHDLTLRYLQAQFIQTAQTAGCNARHTVEQRLARWLLLCADRIGQQVLPLSHEYLADMLGVTRSSVTLVAGHLQERGLIRYVRGKINILDLPGLEALSCECYRVVRDHLGNLLNNDEEYGADPDRKSPVA